MTEIITRQTSGTGATVKGAPLTNEEMDNNLIGLNSDKYESGDSPQFADVVADSLQLTGGTGTQGLFSWNADEETVDLIQNGATLQLGQELHYHVRNDTGSAIPDGTAVMVVGTLGASGRLLVAPMDATNFANERYYIGVTTESIASGDDGKVTAFGKIRNIDTSAYPEGAVLWLSGASGGFSTVEPSVGIKIPSAIVISSKNNGVLFVRDRGSIGLEDLHDFDKSVTALNNDVVSYDSTLGAYKPQSITDIGGATSAQGALADSAIQPSSNISLLINDSGYLTKPVADGYYEPLIATANRQTFYRQATAPSGGVYREGDLWYKTDNESIYFYREVSTGVFNWEPLLASEDDSNTLDGGSY